MLTLLIYALIAIVLVGGLFIVAAKFLPAGEQIAPPVRDEPIWTLPPERPLVADDVATVRLPVALRGYRFAETDLLLDRLTEEIKRRDEEIARLRGDAPAEPAAVEKPAEASIAAAEPDDAAAAAEVEASEPASEHGG